MRVLLDQGTPVPLRRHLPKHQVMTASEMHWAPLTDRDLLDRAEAERFDALVTTDRNLKHQQNLAGRRIAILALSTTSWPRIQKALPAISDAVDRIREGAYIELLVD